MSGLGDYVPKDASFDSIKESAGKITDDVGSAFTKAGNSASDFLKNGTSNFSLAGMGTKITEGAQKLLGGTNLGNLLGFKNIANGLPSGALAKKLMSEGISMGKGQTLSDRTSTAQARANIDEVIVTLRSTVTPEFVKFQVTPRLSESRQANYAELNLVHHPGSILKYERTGARSWTLNVKLVSRTTAEASANQRDLNIIRSWVMPFYGEGTNQNSPDMLGAPPPVLKLSGYGSKNIAPIPVVLESYSTNWPNDIDYIPTAEGLPFPVIMELDLTLKEAYSPAEYSNFNLFAYKSGDLSQAFNGKKFEVAAAAKANGKADTSEGKKLPVLGGKSMKVPSASDITGKIKEMTPNIAGATKDGAAGQSIFSKPITIGGVTGDSDASFKQFQSGGSNSA